MRASVFPATFTSVREREPAGDEQPQRVGMGDVFGDNVVATAILDRLLPHSMVMTLRGDSLSAARKAPVGLDPKKRAGCHSNRRMT